jgi:hypothetical protein
MAFSMNRIEGFALFFLMCSFSISSYSQTCTVTGTSPLNWANPGPSCNEGGNAGSYNVLVIPAGFTVVFNSTNDTWEGTRIDVYGTLQIDKDVTIKSSITVYNGGLLKLQAKLFIGVSPGCGYGLSIKPGGTVDVGGTGSDRLSICGAELMKGNGACNSCGGTNSGTCAYNGSPYCEPSGGFTGPLGYDENGYDVVLPIKLTSLEGHQVDNLIHLNWSTGSEENFDKFIVEHSTDGQNFDSIGYVRGAGNSKQLLKYSFIDQSPILGKNYYRLKSVDYDLSFEYSPLIRADFLGAKNIMVYPNPTESGSINVQTNFSPQEGDRIEIYDNLGLKLMQFNVQDNISLLQFNQSIKQGSYLLRYVSIAHSQVIRFNTK